MVLRQIDLRGTFRRAYQRARGSDLTPLRFALSLAVGLWVGCLPLYGVHFFLCALLTLPLRLNLLIAYAAAHISIPPTVPLLWFLSLELGSLALTGSLLPLSFAEFTLARAAELGGRLLVGSMLLGAVLGAVGGTIAYVVLRRAGRRKEGMSEAVRIEQAVLRTAARYAHAPRSARYYVRFKLLLDPLAEQLAAAFRRFIPEAVGAGRVILDAGTGRGQYALFLHEMGLSTRIIGFDHDADKVALAARSAQGHELSFEVRDVRQGPFPACDVVLLLDVLHYLSPSEQIDVLGLAAAALPEGGHVLVRETDRGAGLGARVAAWLERAARFLGINRGERLEMSSTRSLEDQLRHAGFLVLSADRTGTLDNVLVVGQKAGRPSEPSRPL